MKLYLRPDSPTPNFALGIYWGMLVAHWSYIYLTGMEGEALYAYPAVLSLARAVVLASVLVGILALLLFALREISRWHGMTPRVVSSVAYVTTITRAAGGEETTTISREVRFVDDDRAYRVDSISLEKGKKYNFKARRLLIDDTFVWEAKDFTLVEAKPRRTASTNRS